MSTCPFQLIVLELYLHLTSLILPPSSFLRPENVLTPAERDVLYEPFVPQYNIMYIGLQYIFSL